MDTTTFDANTLTLLVAILGSTLTTVTLMYRLFGRLDTKFDNKFDGLSTQVTGLKIRVEVLETKITAIDTKVTALDAKVEALPGDVADTRERVARIEGHLMAPESFTTGGLSPATPDEARSEDQGSDPDHRQAG